MTPRWRSWWRNRTVRNWAIVVLIFVLLVGAESIGASSSSRLFDPDSTKASGTKAFVLLMQQAGIDVQRDASAHGNTAILLSDTMTQAETDAVEQWVRAGNTLIVSDIYSSLQPGTVSSDVQVVPNKLTPKCDVRFLNGVSHISPTDDGSEAFFKPEPGASTQCFPDSKTKGYFLQAGNVGRGVIVSLGGSEIFTNARLDRDDNSVLLMNILRAASADSVTLLETRDTSSAPASGGQSSLSDLIAQRVHDAFILLLVAAALFIAWNARRFGRPIEEQPKVCIPASQLVVATGDLLETAQQPQAAACILRDDFKRALADRFGLGVDVDAGALAELVSQRTGIDQGRLLSAMGSDAVVTPESLVAYAQHIERLQQEVNNVR